MVLCGDAGVGGVEFTGVPGWPRSLGEHWKLVCAVDEAWRERMLGVDCPWKRRVSSVQILPVDGSWWCAFFQSWSRVEVVRSWERFSSQPNRGSCSVQAASGAWLW